MRLISILALITIVGCASTKDIDLSHVDSACGQTCSANYGECLGKFSMTPIMAQHGCVDALRLCAQSCPPRAPPPP